MARLGLEQLYSPTITSGPAAEFIQSRQSDFEGLRNKDDYLEQMVICAETLGAEYVAERVKSLDQGRFNQTSVKETILAKDFGSAEKASEEVLKTAIAIARETEDVKTNLIFREVLANPNGLSNVEKILLIGGLALSRETDTIFFDEWRPKIKESAVGKALRDMEAQHPGSSRTVLPQDPAASRWYTREFIDSSSGAVSGNIRLVPYRESLPTVPKLIQTIDKMAHLLYLEKRKGSGSDDYGYVNFLRAWSACLSATPDNQKEREDEMMIAWRKIDPEAPVFMVPWAEYDYDDPAGIAIIPSLRIGVKSSNPEVQKLTREGHQLQRMIMEFVREKGVAGVESVSSSSTMHRVWTGYAGLDLILPVSSQVLPNDPDIRRKYGCFILPNLAQQEKGFALREQYARKGYPDDIEYMLRMFRFTPLEVATIEMEGHERFHPVGVTDGEDNLGKLKNFFEEAKATFGAMLVQVQTYDTPIFSARAVASLLYPAPRYLMLDGNPTHQGYANESRIAASIAERVGILTYNESTDSLNLDLYDEQKIKSFWMEVEKFVDWCFRAYRLADEVEKDGISGLQTSLAHELNQWLGIEEVTNEARIYDGTIKKIKRNLEI